MNREEAIRDEINDLYILSRCDLLDMQESKKLGLTDRNYRITYILRARKNIKRLRTELRELISVKARLDRIEAECKMVVDAAKVSSHHLDAALQQDLLEVLPRLRKIIDRE